MFYVTDEKSIKILGPIKLSNQENKSRATGRIHVIPLVAYVEIWEFFVILLCILSRVLTFSNCASSTGTLFQ